MSNSVDNEEQQVWWIDHGATHHMTMHNDWLLNYKEFVVDKVIIVRHKEKYIKGLGSGSVKIISHINGKSFIRVIDDVLFVPEATRNLFSVLAEHEKHPKSKYKSTPNKCKFLINKLLMFVGSRTLGERLFQIECSIIRSQMDLSNASPEKVLELYHRRWGHLDKSYLYNVLKLHLDFDINQPNKIRETCVLSNLHEAELGGTMVTCKKTGEVISAFLYGPMNVESLHGVSYYLLIKDHYSHYRYVKMLKDKNESEILEEIKFVRNDSKHSITEFILDCGLNFKENSQIKNFLGRYGILWQFRPSPALEQENKIIMEMVSSFKHSNTSLPDWLWAKYVETAVQIVNKLGRSSIPNESPREVWLNRMPEIEHLRIIGSKCYIHKQERLEVGVGYLVGYNDEKSCYRIYIPTKKRVKDYAYTKVLFDEQIVE